MPDRDSTVRILLVRHGQSEWNAAGRWQGSADPPLTELGRDQARYAGDVLAAHRHGFGAVWASDLSRAHETATLMAAALGLAPVRVEARLREAHVGEWEGLTSDEIELAWPGYLGAHRRPPAFEPFESVVARAVPALEDIARSGEAGTAPRLVVAHSGVIRSVVRHLAGADERIPNLGGVWLAAGPASLVVAGRFDPTEAFVTGADGPGEDPADGADTGA
jgi:broad specificity phosphatase PhoE